MPNFAFTTAKKLLLDGNIDFVNDDVRAVFCMTSTTVADEEDVTFLDQFSGAGLDEFDGANSADGVFANRKALASQAVTSDDANNRAEFDATDTTWTSLGAGTRSIKGLLIYKHNTNDADSVPLMWIDDDAPFAPTGGNVTYQWNGDGILQLT